MIQNQLILNFLFIAILAVNSQAQLLNDPTGDQPSPAYTYHQNFGQIVDTAGDGIPGLKFYNRNHVPAMYFHDGFVSYVYTRAALDTTELDTNYRLDLKPVVEVSTSPEGYDTLTTDSHYYYLPQCTGGILVPALQTITYEDIKPGISMHYYSNNAGLKTYIEVDAGVDISGLNFLIDGADSIQVDPYNIDLYLGSDSLTFPTGYAYELESGGATTLLPWQPKFKDAGNDQFYIEDGAYDNTNKLIIVLGNTARSSHSQPGELEWSTYFGTSHSDRVTDVSVDGGGQIHAVGTTMSTTFPKLGNSIFKGQRDVFVSFFKANNELIWTLFFGGSKTEYHPYVQSHKVYTQDVGIVGGTDSDDLPVTPYTNTTSSYHGKRDVFHLRINHFGSIDDIEYIGGEEDDFAWGIDQGLSDEMYIIGSSESANGFNFVNPGGPAYFQDFSAGGQDAFIVKLSGNHGAGFPTLWSTFFGGSGNEFQCDIEYDKMLFQGYNFENSVWISGATESSTLATHNSPPNLPCSVPGDNSFPNCINNATNAYNRVVINTNSSPSDAFIARFTDQGELIWSTPVGGDGYEIQTSLATRLIDDPNDPNYNNLVKVYLTGSVSTNNGNSGVYPTPSGSYNWTYTPTSLFQYQGFIYEFEEMDFKWGTQFGTNNKMNQIDDVAVGFNGETYIVGSTDAQSPGNPLICANPGSSSDFPQCKSQPDLFIQEHNFGYPKHGNNGFSSLGSDGFLAAFNSNRELIWSTYFGGNAGDQVTSVTTSHTANYPDVVIGGFTGSNNQRDIPLKSSGGAAHFQPSKPGFHVDGMLARFNIDFSNAFSVSETTDSAEDNIWAFPNPTKGNLTITLKNIENGTLEVINTHGQTLVSKPIKANKNSIDLSSMANGVYLIRVGQHTQKVIKY